MITNSTTETNIVDQWKAVRKLCTSSHRQYQTADVLINETPPESFYNLPLVLAYAVLDQVLQDLGYNQRQLGDKMEKAEHELSWKNYHLVDCGRIERNRLAHSAKLIPRKECLKYIEAIEEELKGWDILSS